MKKSRLTETQIAKVLKEIESGRTHHADATVGRALVQRNVINESASYGSPKSKDGNTHAAPFIVQKAPKWTHQRTNHAT